MDFYHAERSAEEKERVHREWSAGRVHLICATVAFGMGKPTFPSPAPPQPPPRLSAGKEVFRGESRWRRPESIRFVVGAACFRRGTPRADVGGGFLESVSEAFGTSRTSEAREGCDGGAPRMLALSLAASRPPQPTE